MIIPVKCFTCGKVLADKWEFYVKETKKLEDEAEQKGMKPDEVSRAPIFETLQLDRVCCRRHLLGHVDMMEII